MLPDNRKDFGGFWIRAAAYFIDVLVLLIPNLVVGAILAAILPPVTAPGQNVLRTIPNLVVWWIYLAGLESSSWQASVGKKACGLKVVDKDGNRISFARASGRYFAMFASCLILFIGYIMVGWTERRQALHDMMAGTFIIRDAKPSGRPPSIQAPL